MNGIFNAFDTSIKGEVIISLGNSGEYRAEVRLISGETHHFTTNSLGTENVTFSHQKGSFVVNVLEDRTMEVADFIFDGKESYIRVYKKQRGVDITLALGTYVETGNASFTGNWDVVNLGSQVFPEGLPTVTALGIDDVVVSSPNGSIFSDSDFSNEIIPMCIDYPAFRAYVSIDVTGDGLQQRIEAQDQLSTFGGINCFWGLSADTVLNDILLGYRGNFCQTTSSGTWLWSGRSGTISVSSIGLPPTGPSNL